MSVHEPEGNALLQGADLSSPPEDSSSRRTAPHKDHGSPVRAVAEVKVEAPSPPLSDNSDPNTPTLNKENFPNLKQALSLESARALDSLRKSGTDLVSQILRKLHCAQDSRDARHWEKSFRLLRKRTHNSKTTLGVVGATGQGKSSIINALLDEKKLVPTSCMRACTAVVTEFSWNYSDEPDQRYRGEIKFISPEEWLQELKGLFGDLTSFAGDVSGDYTHKDTDAGVAWAKIKAVYPEITRETFLGTTPESLASDPTVSELLGTTKEVRSAKANLFYADIRGHIDSKEDDVSTEAEIPVGTIDDDNDDDAEYLPAPETTNKKEIRRQFWPLIKVVKIFTKADVLSTGAIIVDLPGVEDSNAARSAVANKYIEKCDGIWVVAAITRAVDDKAAKMLLGQSFRRQLQYDGNYSNVTMICSKTDEIDISEAAPQLSLQHELDDLQAKERGYDEWIETYQLYWERDKSRLKALTTYTTEIDRRLHRWDKLATLVEKSRDTGEVVTLAHVPAKRKAITQIYIESKRPMTRSFVQSSQLPEYKPATDSSGNLTEDETILLRQQPLTEDGYSSAFDFWNNLCDENIEFSEEHPLSEDDIRSMIRRLRETRFGAVDEAANLENTIYSDSQYGCELQNEHSKQHVRLYELCIEGRNQFARKEMREDFAAGIKELDQENSQRENPETFDPDHEVRDYRKVAQSLSVFCVSSRKYQALSGRLPKKDCLAIGFPDIDATGIPQLREHAKVLTERTRVTNNKLFLGNLLESLNSLHIWASTDVNGLVLTDEEKEAEIHNVKQDLIDLDADLRTSLASFIHECRDVLTEKLFDRFETAVSIALQAAPQTVQGWPQRKGNDNGLRCQSYRAVCRRNGVFSGSRGLRNFNEELLRPIIQNLAGTWENVFEQKIPSLLDDYVHASEKLLEGLHTKVKERMQTKASFASINALQVQIQAHAHNIKLSVKNFSRRITQMRREAHRKFEPAIQENMVDTYQLCGEEAGSGCFVRIQNHMMRAIEDEGEAIFRGVTDPVKDHLLELCRSLEEEMGAKIAQILDRMRKDYDNVIIGSDITESSQRARSEIHELLQNVDAEFQHDSAETTQ
ncbi:hypothetical protein F4778DRAFT_782503 [Xylariomycetidae sp. FL2044]|nr:hypothetical protein F4778DRAFT_782503 [Xylariomycetidae sp. FL2044]